MESGVIWSRFIWETCQVMPDLGGTAVEAAALVLD